MAFTEIVLQDIKISFVDVHLNVKTYWISPATLWKFTSVIMLFFILHGFSTMVCVALETRHINGSMHCGLEYNFFFKNYTLVRFCTIYNCLYKRISKDINFEKFYESLGFKRQKVLHEKKICNFKKIFSYYDTVSFLVIFFEIWRSLGSNLVLLSNDITIIMKEISWQSRFRTWKRFGRHSTGSSICFGRSM